MLALRLFYPSNDKVRQVEFHPVLPWVVSATKSDHVAVWDWYTKQLVWEAHLGGGSEADSDLCADAELARLHLRDRAFSPNPSLLHPIPPGGPKREPTGKVRDVRFLDCDVAQVQLTWQHTTAYGCGTPPPRAEDIRALRGQRLLVIGCESKVLVVDLASRRVLELGKAALEGRSPSCLAFLFRAGPHGGHGGHGGLASPPRAGYGGGGRGYGGEGPLLESPVLAVGCADGIVRCVQLFPIKPVARLVSSHKTPVVALAALGMRGQRGVETLAVGHAGGRVVLFEPLGGHRQPSAAAAAALSEGVAPRAEYRAHERELLPGSLAVVSVEEDPENTRYRLFSAGADNRLCGLDPGSLKGAASSGSSSDGCFRIKVEGASVTCMAHWPRGWTASGVHSLLLGTEAGHLLLAHPLTGSVRRAADLQGLVPAGHKKAPKVYGIHVHPLMPYVVAAATNSGTAILVTTSPHQPLAAAALPLAAPSQALADEGAAAMGVAFGGGGGAGGGGATYVTAMGNQVLCVTAATLPNQELSDYPPNQVMGKLEVAGGTPGGRPLVTVSHDGGYVAVAWPGARRYAVYQQGASAWREVAQGTGTSVAWHSCRPAFAALEEDAPHHLPPPPPPQTAPGSGGKLSGRKAERRRCHRRRTDQELGGRRRRRRAGCGCGCGGSCSGVARRHADVPAGRAAAGGDGTADDAVGGGRAGGGGEPRRPRPAAVRLVHGSASGSGAAGAAHPQLGPLPLHAGAGLPLAAAGGQVPARLPSGRLPAHLQRRVPRVGRPPALHRHTLPHPHRAARPRAAAPAALRRRHRAAAAAGRPARAPHHPRRARLLLLRRPVALPGGLSAASGDPPPRSAGAAGAPRRLPVDGGGAGAADGAGADAPGVAVLLLGGGGGSARRRVSGLPLPGSGAARHSGGPYVGHGRDSRRRRGGAPARHLLAHGAAVADRAQALAAGGGGGGGAAGGTHGREAAAGAVSERRRGGGVCRRRRWRDVRRRRRRRRATAGG